MAKLYFRHGTMDSAKTLNLLAVAHNYRSQGKRVLLVKPRTDDRFGAAAIRSRAGIEAEADLLVDDATRLDPADFRGVDCVLVDEAQFLAKAHVWQLGDVVDRLGIPVLAYGLRTDFRGELFEGSHYLLAWADELEEIKTICHTGKKATMVVRVDGNGRAVREGPQVEIGGNDRYVSVSRAEYKRVLAGETSIELQQPMLPLGYPSRPRR